MSDPKRIKYCSDRNIPPVSNLIDHITRDQHLVLELPANYDKKRIGCLVSRIASEVPENYVVFDAGAFQDKTCVTIKQVVNRAAVIEMEGELVHAAHHFHQTADQLAGSMAEYNNIANECIWDNCRDLESHSSDWKLDVHGQHCCFVHHNTGQTVEISMWFGTHFGVLDPYFFYDYMKTTPELLLPVELRDAFHDTRRAMDILEERGRLIRLTGLFGSQGLAAPPETKRGITSRSWQSATR